MTPKEFVNFIEDLIPEFENQDGVKKVSTRHFSFGDELIITLINPIDSYIVIKKEYADPRISVEYYFGYTMMGNKISYFKESQKDQIREEAQICLKRRFNL